MVYTTKKNCTDRDGAPALNFSAVQILQFCREEEPGLELASPIQMMSTTLEAIQGQIDGFFRQLPFKCHHNQVASQGD
jgi:hypothetical protein